MEEQQSTQANSLSDLEKSLADLPLVFPEDIRYNCQCCGRCCAGWAVGLTNVDYAKVKDVKWGELHPELAGGELFINREKEFLANASGYPYYVKPRADGRCSFLVDNMCFMHKTLGETSKPGMCQLFPYTFTATPDGVYVGIVFNSMAAARNLGSLLSEQEEMLRGIWKSNLLQQNAMAADAARRAPAVQTANAPAPEAQAQNTQAQNTQAQNTSSPAAAASSVEPSISIENETLQHGFTVMLQTGLPVSWAEYKHVDNKLLSLTKDATIKNAFQLWSAAYQVVMESCRLKRANEDLAVIAQFQPKLDSWLTTPVNFQEKLLFYGLVFRNFVFPTLRFDIREWWSSNAKSPLTDPKVLSAVIGTVLFKKADLPKVGKVDLDKCLLYRIDDLSQPVDDYFRRYFYLRVFTKTYFGSSLAGLSVVSGMQNLLSGFLCVMLYAKAHAMVRGDKELQMTDLYEGYHMVDKEIVSLSQLPAERAGIYDMAFSLPGIFNRLLSQLARATGNQ